MQWFLLGWYFLHRSKYFSIFENHSPTFFRFLVSFSPNIYIMKYFSKSFECQLFWTMQFCKRMICNQIKFYSFMEKRFGGGSHTTKNPSPNPSFFKMVLLHSALLLFLTQTKKSMDFFTFILQLTIQNQLKKISDIGLPKK